MGKINLSQKQLDAFAGCYVINHYYISGLGRPEDTTEENLKIFYAGYNGELKIFTAKDFKYWSESELDYMIDDGHYIDSESIPSELKIIIDEHIARRNK